MVRQLRSGSGLSLEETENKYKVVWQEFERIKGNYSGLFGVFRKHMKNEDRKSLTNCIDSLLLLASEDFVQMQLRRTKNPRETLDYMIRELSIQILEYLENFTESGNERLGVRPRVYYFQLYERK